MPNPTQRASIIFDERLTQLIRLKRNERPAPEFWVQFDQEFRSRQLSSFVRIQPWHTKLRRVCGLAVRKTALLAAALGAIAVTLIVVTNTTSYLAEKPSEEEPQDAELDATPARATEPAKPVFVVRSDEEGEQKDNELQAILNTRQSAVYQVNALSSARSAETRYQLMVTPVTYSHGEVQDSASTEIGAKVIRTKPNP